MHPGQLARGQLENWCFVVEEGSTRVAQDRLESFQLRCELPEAASIDGKDITGQGLPGQLRPGG